MNNNHFQSIARCKLLLPEVRWSDEIRGVARVNSVMIAFYKYTSFNAVTSTCYNRKINRVPIFKNISVLQMHIKML